MLDFCAIVLAVRVDAEDDEWLAFQTLHKRPLVREHRPAGASPVAPKVEHHYLAAVVAQLEAVAVNVVALNSRVLHHVSASPGRKLRDEENTWRLVRRWRDILDENRTRLRFMTSNLEHDPSLEDGLNHIRQQYADLLPEALRTDT